ncbi:unnamed protein product [Rhodiola kirilowii]
MQEPSALSKAYAMEGGDGPTSYAKNSTYQRKVAELAKELIHQAIAEKLDLKSMCLASNKFCIADFGCSTGPNTFISVQNIIQGIELGHPSLHQNLIFQVFFNDHVSNDFNTLFKTIPPSSRYYAAGVPGSFHGRLFPDSSLQIAHSSYSLHWLSKAPEGITNRGSILWNGAGNEVAEAYLAQYRSDMDSFLSARAKELIVGGLLMACFTVRPNGVILCRSSFTSSLMGACLFDMAKEGLILEEDVISFNLPIYYPSVEELEGIIQQNGSFSIEKMEVLELHMDPHSITPEMIASLLKAVFGSVIGENFGYDIMDDMFCRYPDKFKQNAQYLRSLDFSDMFILLKCTNK